MQLKLIFLEIYNINALLKSLIVGGDQAEGLSFRWEEDLYGGEPGTGASELDRSEEVVGVAVKINRVRSYLANSLLALRRGHHGGRCTVRLGMPDDFGAPVAGRKTGHRPCASLVLSAVW